MDERTEAGDVVPEQVRVVIDDLRDRLFVRNRDFVHLEDGLVAILVPRFDGWFLKRFLMPRLRRPLFRIKLDSAGSFVWKELDGISTVGEIADRWSALNECESMPHARVALFVRLLAVQGHVVEVDRRDGAC